MSKREISFGVVESNKCASVWKLKTNKKSPDVYLSSNRLGTIHASMHKDGNWHIKFGKIEEKINTSINQEVTDAYLDKWKRPAETKPRITMAFRIHTPHPSPNKKKRFIKKSFVEIPNAPEKSAVEILIFFVVPNTELSVKNAGIIGKLDLSNGEMVVATYRNVPINIPANLQSNNLSIPDITDRISYKDLLQASLGTVLFGTAPDGSRMLWDIRIHITPKGFIKLLKLKVKKSIKKLISKT